MLKSIKKMCAAPTLCPTQHRVVWGACWWGGWVGWVAIAPSQKDEFRQSLERRFGWRWWSKVCEHLNTFRASPNISIRGFFSSADPAERSDGLDTNH